MAARARAATDGVGDADLRYMRRALALAERGWGQVAPNPLVGAVLVQGGRVVGEGYHAAFGREHAEVMALARAGAGAHGSTAYVTLEPCAHHGKTPPCADALIEAGVSRVVVATRDPNPQAAGGIERLRARGIVVEVGLCEQEARDLNADFIFAQHADRPWVTLKLAVSIDAALADYTRKTGWLTGPESRAEVHRLRAQSDAVAVGMGTVLADDPALTVRDAKAPRVAPRRVVFSRAGRLPVTSVLAATARKTPVLVLADQPDPAYEATLHEMGVELVAASTLGEGMRALRSRGIRSLIVEGGAKLASALLRDGLVDRLVVFSAPVLLGDGALPAFAGLTPQLAGEARRLRVVARRTFGNDIMSSYALTDPVTDPSTDRSTDASTDALTDDARTGEG